MLDAEAKQHIWLVIGSKYFNATPTTAALHTETVLFPVVKYHRSPFQLRGSILRRLHARRTSRSFVISLITTGSGCSAVSSCPTPKRIWWESPDRARAQPGATSGGESAKNALQRTEHSAGFKPEKNQIPDKQ